jgi:hypothetical protein
MAIVVEDGTGVPTADSWVSIQQADTYATAMGNTAWVDGDQELKEQALRRGARFIIAVYALQFPGKRTYSIDQSLPWPRSGVVDLEGNDMASDFIPPELQKAQIEAAFREFDSPGSLIPVSGVQRSAERNSF